MCIKMYSKQVCQNPQQMAKNREILFSLLDNPTLNAYLKLQHLKGSFSFSMNMKFLIILKMPVLVLSTILDLMLVLVSLNTFGILGW